jgi:hypothetical protein
LLFDSHRAIERQDIDGIAKSLISEQLAAALDLCGSWKKNQKVPWPSLSQPQGHVGRVLDNVLPCLGRCVLDFDRKIWGGDLDP